MDPRFACVTLFLHLLILLENGAARVLDNEKLSKISNDNHKDTNVRLHDVKQHIVDNQFWIYDKKDHGADNQFWIYDKKNSATDNQFWIYDKKNSATDNQFWIYDKKNDAVDNQAWIYDKKNDATDNQAWMYDKKNGAIDDKKNDAADNQVWIYDKKNDAVDNQAWIYDGKSNVVDIYGKKNDAQDNQAWIYDKKNDAIDNQLWIYDKKNDASSNIDHMDPKLFGFFNLEDLKIGNKMVTKFPKTDPSSSLLSLPKAKADRIPFSLIKFPSILEFFPFSQDSPQAKVMEDTLRKCEAKPIKGEKKFCATSYESMLNFAKRTFGLQMQTNIQVLSTVHLTGSTDGIQKYTIVKVPERISAPKMVACHTMPYPYKVFYCHYQESESRVYKVSLNGGNGDGVEAIAVCHMDTSHWSPDHVSFSVLGIKPGTSPVCHFFAANHLVLVPSASV
ncbi:hypothetical protein ACH5RR_022087 [Cinchona calisaya]|uniref:BURP domain-containing protein n=1 Tax=Cinchona calisaya TaxID=153742 RepID=A0ABD2ZA39_9GENT